LNESVDLLSRVQGVTNEAGLNSEELFHWFGRSVSELEQGGVFQRLNTFNRPASSDDGDDGSSPFHDWVLVRRFGLELGFSTSNFQTGTGPLGDWVHGEMLLTQLYFYAGREDLATYQGLLPFGLTWSDSRSEAREKLYPFDATRHSSATDAWDVPGYRITLAYAGNGARLSRVVCRVMPQPIKASARPAVPSLNDVLRSVGESVRDAGFLSCWGNFVGREHLAAAEESRSIDLIGELGVSLGLVSSPAGSVVRSVTLHSNRDLGSAGWRGELPFGLSFEDSPEVLDAKAPLAPIQRETSELTGHAVWSFEAATVHVLFSNVDNRLVRVKVMAPGTWRSIHDEC
jgi:hypothetical protein